MSVPTLACTVFRKEYAYASRSELESVPSVAVEDTSHHNQM